MNFTRQRSTWLAGLGAMLLVVMISGVVAGANLLVAAGPTVAAVVDTTASFEDTNGNGIDDDCEAAVTADPAAAAAAELAADLDGDGQISVTEAAHSGRTGGTNCNHGGYVSQVAHDKAPCVEVPAPEPVASDILAANAHGAWVSLVAQSEAIGGKNCNHGGAVSEAAQADREARAAAKAERKAEHDAAKAVRMAERDAAKAARRSEHDAARAERKAEHDAARAERTSRHATSKGKSH